VEKKGSGGSPIQFLCSGIYDFWGLLITVDEQQGPANKERIGKQCVFASTLKSKGTHMLFFILASLAGLCHSSIVINNPPKVVDLVAQKFY